MAQSAKHRAFIAPLSLVTLLSILILFLFNGTGWEADSYHHHLIAKLAPKHPGLFLDHWGKPFYTLISSPFAQFGFQGSKIFNVICSLLSMYVSYLILKRLKASLAHWVILIFFLIPLNFQISFSSFTEAFFALILVSGIFLAIDRKYFTAAFFISLLPLIRSEGLLFIMIFALYFIFLKKFKSIPFLLFGQLIYAFIGMLFFQKSFLWIFTEIPYASMDSPYGSGQLFHFPEQLFYVLGPLLMILFVLSLFIVSWTALKKNKEVGILILLSFLLFFAFHSFSWYLGWFNSMGLKRVFGAVIPLMAILIILGLEPLMGRLQNKNIQFAAMTFICLLSGGLLFSKGPAGINWNKEMNLSPTQVLTGIVVDYVEDNDLEKGRLIFADRYLAEGFKVDIYESGSFHILNKSVLEDLRDQDLIIWDSWHGPVDFGISLEQLESTLKLIKLKEFETQAGNRTVQYIVFQYED